MIKGKNSEISYYKKGRVLFMNDWNGNGKYDSYDSFVDYHCANSGHSGASSDWWKFVLLAIVMGICSVLGMIIVFGILLLSK